MDQKSIKALKFLGVDMINKANSGHPGIVLGAAPMLHTLFTRHININPKNDKWFNRDRFILSAGHGSALLYGINHLVGYDIQISDLKNFRQVGNTPGHPEYGHTAGVETTSGPLGQGISNAVGMAIAETHLGARFNQDGLKIVDHYTYVLCGDGDLQEGVTMESMSLAGHLGLSKLIVLFDSNDIQLDGEVSLAYSENHAKRFSAQGWQHLVVSDGTNVDEIDRAIEAAKQETERPSIIEVKTVIGADTHVAGKSASHGNPIGFEETTKLRERLNWEYEPFVVPSDVYDFYRETTAKRGSSAEKGWEKDLAQLKKINKDLFTLFESFIDDNVIIDVSEYVDVLVGEKAATRNVSGKVIDHLSKKYLNLIGGSADLTGSTKAKGADGHYSKTNRLGRNINFGVREHAMAAITNGIVLHGGLKSFCGGFFVFSDYMKPAIRLAALMKIPSIFVFTHDSIGVGEDGPTHQPVEQLAGLRVIPNLNVIRPADANETLGAWKIAMESKHTPTVIVLTRQNVLNQTHTDALEVKHGAYIVSKETSNLDGIILAAGSELELAMKVKEALKAQNKDIRVVSMPSHLLYGRMERSYQSDILPVHVPIVAIEMGSRMPWYQYTPFVYGIDEFGLSAPLNVALKEFGFTVEDFLEYCAKVFR